MSGATTDEKVDRILDVLAEYERRLSEVERALAGSSKGARLPEVREKDVVQRVLSSSLEVEHYSSIHGLSGLPLFLTVLEVASRKFGVDALSPSEISAILEGKFGIKAERSNVSHTLSSGIAGGFVDRITNARGSGYVYRITQKGLKYLATEISTGAEPGTAGAETL